MAHSVISHCKLHSSIFNWILQMFNETCFPFMQICNGKPFRVFQRQCLHLVTAAPSYRLCKPRGHGGKRSQHTSNSHLDCGCVTLVAKETFEGKRQAM
ncbi:uncharacterized protein LOC142573248 isoform X3 [Dermacentor variabilis]|uniref:uncharacterized protein LOC142573248 isoform X3 n=1 Tax=Dermacentor variabilis TaxID=34621 RepID=UPI003F5C86F4